MIRTFKVRFDLLESESSCFELTLSIKLRLIEVMRRLGIAAFAKHKDGPRAYLWREFDHADEGIAKPSVPVLLAFYVGVVRLIGRCALQAVNVAPCHMPRSEVVLKIAHGSLERSHPGHAIREIPRFNRGIWRFVSLPVSFQMPLAEQGHGH